MTTATPAADPVAASDSESTVVACDCGRTLRVPERLFGRRLKCPFCGDSIAVPDAPATDGVDAPDDFAGSPPDADAPEPRRSPTVRPDPEPADGRSVWRRMFEALLDPRSTQWLLMLGGGLAVLGLVIWLVSLGVFENPLVMAVALGVGSLAVLAAGWWVSLRTKYATAGRALTFLACVVTPLNLWFYHAQGLVTVDGGLWVGGVVCCLLYLATVLVLRDPAFMYAILGGVVLTLTLLLGDLGRITDPAWLSLFLMAFGLVALHAERAFPAEAPVFRRDRFGTPLFRGGLVLVTGALLILFGVQLVDWFQTPFLAFLDEPGASPFELVNALATSAPLAAGIWAAGAYAFGYAEFVRPAGGRRLFEAAVCLVFAEVTLVWTNLPSELLIAALALTALAANAAQAWLVRRDGADRHEELGRGLPKIGLILNLLPPALGVALHWRATSAAAAGADWAYETGWLFVAAMAVVAVCDRFSAHLFRTVSPRWAATYLFLTGAAVLIGAAGLLRVVGVTDWVVQAPVLMLVPILYLAAVRLWRGRPPERPLYWVAQGGAAVILAHVLVGTLREIGTLTAVRGEAANLWLGVTFLLAAVFYFLAAVLTRETRPHAHRYNVPLGAAAVVAALWQFLGYADVPPAWYTAIFAAVGLAGIAAGRWRGVEVTMAAAADIDAAARNPRPATGSAFDRDFDRAEWRGVGLPDWRPALGGRGTGLYYAGAGTLFFAVLAAVMQGLGRLAADGAGWPEIATLLFTAAASAVGAALSPLPGWRRLFAVAAVAAAGLGGLTLLGFLDLTPARKVGLAVMTAGLLILGASLAGRFRPGTGRNEDLVAPGLWVGSALATLPILFAVLHHRLADHDPSLKDELILVTVTVLVLAAGVGWRVRAPTFLGGGVLGLYLVVLVGSLAYHPQVAVGIYLTIGGALLFAGGLVLSVYRDRILALPDRVAERQGVFRVLDWR